MLIDGVCYYYGCGAKACCCSAEMGCMLLRIFCFAVEELRVRVREGLGLVFVIGVDSRLFYRKSFKEKVGTAGTKVEYAASCPNGD